MILSLVQPLIKESPLVISIYSQYWQGEGINPPPPGSSVRITDEAEIRITDSDDIRITD